MKSFLLLFLLLFALACPVVAQTHRAFADSIRQAYNIPELAYAIVSADSVIELEVTGVQRIGSSYAAGRNDRFHLGSNTKAITAFIAATLVRDGKIEWESKLMDVLPELKAASRKVYRNITLKQLLTFRGKVQPYTYTFEQPTNEQITGDEATQRFLLAQYFLSQPPMKPEDGLTPSNADYVLAGLMLERASGKPYKQLVMDLGSKLGITFGFDNPNYTDTLQPWGHNYDMQPVPPFDNYKLNWLLSAGNINASMPDYARFVQLMLKGLQGQANMLPKEVFHQLLFGEPVFAYGWYNNMDETGKYHVAHNHGNAGAFISRVQLIDEEGRAYIILANSASAKTSEGAAVLMKRLQQL